MKAKFYIAAVLIALLLCIGCAGGITQPVKAQAAPLDDCFILIHGILTVEDMHAFQMHCLECHPTLEGLYVWEYGIFTVENEEAFYAHCHECHP